MPTIIDALVLELQIDPSGVITGRKKSAEELTKLQDEVRTRGKNIEDAAKKATESFSKLRDEVIALFAVFTTGKGIKEFVADITNSDAAIGRTARTLNMTVGELAAWRQAATLVGGSAQGITGSMTNLTRELNNFLLTGQSAVIPYFRAFGISIVDSNNKLKTAGQLYLEVAQSIEDHKVDPATAATMLQAMGADEGTINLILQGRAAIQGMLDEQARLGKTSAEDAKLAQERQAAWAELMATWTNVGRILLSELTPALISFGKALIAISEWAQQHPIVINAAFGLMTLAITGLSLALFRLPFLATVAGFRLLMAPLTSLIGILPRLMLWLATLTETALPALSEAFLAVGAAIELTPIGWIITGIAAIAAGAYALYSNWSSISGWWSSLWSGMAGDTDKAKKRITAPAGPMTTSPRPRAGTAVEKLMGMGWSREQAGGIVANLQRESGGNPRAVGDHGQAYGLGQWHPDRQRRFEQWAGHSIQASTLDEQLAFVNYELRGPESRAGNALLGAKSAGEAASIVSRLYERPANGDREAAIRSSMAASGSMLGMARQGTAASSLLYDSRRTSSSSTINDVKIGTIVVETQADDAEGIAKSIGPAVQRNSFAQQGNYGSN